METSGLDLGGKALTPGESALFLASSLAAGNRAFIDTASAGEPDSLGVAAPQRRPPWTGLPSACSYAPEPGQGRCPTSQHRPGETTAALMRVRRYSPAGRLLLVH